MQEEIDALLETLKTSGGKPRGDGAYSSLLPHHQCNHILQSYGVFAVATTDEVTASPITHTDAWSRLSQSCL